MKRIITIAIFAFTGILRIGNAMAQEPAVQVKVPFNFTAGDKQLPAGTYSITLASPGIVEFQNKDRHILHGTTALQNFTKSEDGGKLVFTKYGNRYFLHEILCDFRSMNVDLPTTKAEKRARTQEWRADNGNYVMLALK